MSTTMTQNEVSLGEVVAEVHDPSKSTRENAEASSECAATTEAHRYKAEIEGWQQAVLRHEARQFRARSIRSGHNNGSGRLRGVASLPNRGILGATVRTNSGASYLMGDVTLEVGLTLKAEYGQRKQTNAAGEKFWAAVTGEMAKGKLDTLAQLGEERVEVLRVKFGYRVHD